VINNFFFEEKEKRVGGVFGIFKIIKNLSKNHEITYKKNAKNRIESSNEIFVIAKSISG
jgi:hypothetical protein